MVCYSSKKLKADVCFGKVQRGQHYRCTLNLNEALVVILVSIVVELSGDIYQGWSRGDRFEKNLGNTVRGL